MARYSFDPPSNPCNRATHATQRSITNYFSGSPAAGTTVAPGALPLVDIRPPTDRTSPVSTSAQTQPAANPSGTDRTNLDSASVEPPGARVIVTQLPMPRLFPSITTASFNTDATDSDD